MPSHLTVALDRSPTAAPPEATNWTVIGEESVTVGGRCEDIDDFEQLRARAVRLAGNRRVAVEASCEPGVGAGHSVLMLGTPIRFGSNSPTLLPEGAASLDFLAGVRWQFDEVLAWAEGEGDSLQFDAQAAELVRQRTATLVAYLEYRGVRRVETRVQIRRRNVPVLRPTDRRIELRIS